MLTKKHRFQGPAGLTRVYQKGQTVRSQFCAARFSSGKREGFRVAVVVSKKVAKSAPERNRIRRRVYEIIRLSAAEHLTNEDIVITIFDVRLATIEHEELQEIIMRLLQQIRDGGVIH